MIGNDGLKALSDACMGGALEKCTTLHLQWNRITDDGAQALAAACAGGALKRCRVLVLNGNKITAVGLVRRTALPSASYLSVPLSSRSAHPIARP